MTQLFQPAYERVITTTELHPGAMIAFLLDEATQQALIDACAPLTVAPDHVTLVYLSPEAASLDSHKSALIRFISDTACYTAPIEGAVNGFGRFAAAEGEDASALYASVDCPALPAFRQRLWDAACMAGCSPVAEHGFVPHITLAYLPTSDATPSLDLPNIPLRFDRFALVWGGETITFPFSEDMSMADEYRSAPEDKGQYLRGYCERAVAQGGKPGDPIRFIASTENVARDGMVIEAAGWQLDNYRKNPVVLWSHDIIGARPPIGRAEVKVEGRALVADITFDQGDPFAVDVERKYRAGYLHGVSVRWDPKEMAPARSGQPPRFTRQDLLEISAVTVPSDPSALKQERIRAIQDELAELAAPATDPAVPTWPEVAADMAALILFPTSRSGKAWRLEYHRLSRLYDQLGKEPPERLAPDYLAALESDAVAGLFLEDERDVCPDLFTQRAAQASPHALTAADRADLALVVERLQRVLASDAATPTAKQPTEQPPAEAADVVDPALLSLASILGAR
jgi:HK97 family phage prohead protease